MKSFGISIYPEKSSFNEIKDYIELTSKYGFSKMFLNFLQITEENKNDYFNLYKKIIKVAKENKFEVIIDISEKICDVLNIKNWDVKIFHEMGVNYIRVDEGGGDGIVESKILNNNYGIGLEINGSMTTELAEILAKKNIDKSKVCVSHNFYPQKYTGLSLEYFLKNTKIFKKLGFRTSAFISSQSAKLGPWDVNDGLPTLEMHRNLGIVEQVKHFNALGIVDDLIISNCFASEKELKEISKINPDLIELKIEVAKKISDSESKVLFEYNNHFRRPDLNEYSVRSTMSRIDYKTNDFPVRKSEKKYSYGDVLIGNNDFKNYKGELFIVLKETPVDKRKNFVGRIIESNKVLIPFIDSNTKFKFIKN